LLVRQTTLEQHPKDYRETVKTEPITESLSRLAKGVFTKRSSPFTKDKMENDGAAHLLFILLA